MNYLNYITLTIVLSVLAKTGNGKPGGVSQVGFSIYRNRDEQIAKYQQKDPLIVTYSINHPQTPGGRINQVVDPTHHFERHQVHQQQFESLRLAQQRQRHEHAEEQIGQQQGQGQHGPEVMRHVPTVYQVPVKKQEFVQTMKRPEQPFTQSERQATSNIVVIDSVPLPQPQPKTLNNGGRQNQNLNVLDINEVLDGNYPVQYY